MEILIKIPEQKQAKRIKELVERIMQLHKENPTGNEKDRLSQQIKNVDYEIDEEIYKLYGITNEEKKIVEES